MLFEALLTYPSTGFCKTLFLLFSNFGALIQGQKAKNGQMDSWEHSSSLFDDMPLETRDQNNQLWQDLSFNGKLWLVYFSSGKSLIWIQMRN